MQKLAFVHRRRNGAFVSDESGQTMIFVVVGLAVVLLAIVGFAVDYGNIWFRRQHAQNAADAACTAAAMDMLNSITTGTTTTGGLTTGTNVDCATPGTPVPAPCTYASLNGYDGAGLTAATANQVLVTFPTSLTGDPIPICPNPIPSTMKVCIPPSSMTTNPFVQVKITSRLKATFFGLLSANNTVDVPAKASCGLVLSSAPIPLLVLDPYEVGNTEVAALKVAGTGNISIYGGPSQSIQVNSSTVAKALDFNGNSMRVDLTQGGPSVNGSVFGIYATPSPAPSTSAATDLASCSTQICLNTGKYSTGIRPILDPFALTITAPQPPTFTGAQHYASAGPNGGGNRDHAITNGNEGCIDPAGCDVYSPGDYTDDIIIKNKTAIFEPGIYYLRKSFALQSGSCVRPSNTQGDGSGGTYFYFAGTGTLNVVANSGACTGLPAFVPKPSAVPVSGMNGLSYGVACDSLSYTNMPANLTTSTTITGSVLLAPCLNPNSALSKCDPNCGINGGRGYGDPLGATDPAGIGRGLLFMQNRGSVLASNSMPTWQGGGQFLLSGSMYFHQCNTTGTDSGTGCDKANAYNDQLEFGGTPGATSYVLGDIIVDKLYMHGNGSLAMDLSPNAQYFIYKATLMQ